VAFARRRTGRPGPLPSPQEAAGYTFTPAEHRSLREWTSIVVGGPERVRAQLDELLAQTSADELMLTTTVFEEADRVRSYELVAQAMSEHVAPATA
jgi:alkanesulfonate monooxygenase SsuD/methylene tetrahydromethanopterin reductase-like flavin-dependent oxidoreductase (luciferase family)